MNGTALGTRPTSPRGKLELAALGQKCPNYPVSGKKDALAGARVRATSPRFKGLWYALVTFFFYFFFFPFQASWGFPGYPSSLLP